MLEPPPAKAGRIKKKHFFVTRKIKIGGAILLDCVDGFHCNPRCIETDTKRYGEGEKGSEIVVCNTSGTHLSI